MSIARTEPPTTDCPHRDRVRVAIALAALAAGPAAWIVQLVAGYGVASRLCRPGDAPRPFAPAAGHNLEPPILAAVSLACLAIAIAAVFIALADWRRASRSSEAHAGRTRFLSACGVLAGAGFALAIAFNIASPLFVPDCWRFSP